jgi:DNA-binding winged helix-turn-helix (wHTH) protein
MQQSFPSSPFLIGNWIIHPGRREIVRHGQVRMLEPRHMDVLCALAARQREVVSVGELLDACWGGGFYGDNPVHKAVAVLRRSLGDDARTPRYIATVRKRGYRMIARVRPMRGVEERLEAAIRRWGGSPAFQRRMRVLGPDDDHGWQTLTAVLLRVASTLVTDGALDHALDTVDEARGWLISQVAARPVDSQSTKKALSSASA